MKYENILPEVIQEARKNIFGLNDPDTVHDAGGASYGGRNFEAPAHIVKQSEMDICPQHHLDDLRFRLKTEPPVMGGAVHLN